MTLQEIIGAVHQGQPISLNEFEEFVAQAKEGLELDFKSGKLFDRSKERAKKTIREYVAGFANSAGGLLVFGVDETLDPDTEEKVYAVTGCTNKMGQQPIEEWVSRGFSGLVPYLYPPPKTSAIQAPQGKEVILVAVPRSEHLVPCPESGEIAYYLRIGEQTLQAPAYLVEDLHTQRRLRPSFAMFADFRVTEGSGKDRIQLRLRVENTSLIWAPRVFVGMLYFAMEGESGRMWATESVWQAADVPENNPEWCELYQQRLNWDSSLGNAEDLEFAPLTSRSVEQSFISMPRDRAPWQAAVYLVPGNGPPAWYQLEIGGPMKIHDEYTGKDSWIEGLPLERVDVPTVNVGNQRFPSYCRR